MVVVTQLVVQPTGIGWPDYITAISDPSSIAQAVYFDSVAGQAGTNYPVGTASAPVNNLPDLRTICTNRGIRKIVNVDISVLIALDAAMLNYEFTNWYLNLNGQNVTGSRFKNGSLIGIAGGTSLYVEDSILSNITNTGQPYLSGCVVNNNFILPTGVGIVAALINCKYLNCSLYVNDNTIDLVGGEGTLIVRDVDDAASVLNAYGFGGYITLAASCALGIINLYGDFVLTNLAGAGCVVNDYRINKEYGGDTIYFDSVGGEAGTTYPIGSAIRPVNNEADLRAILTARNLRKVVLRGTATVLQFTNALVDVDFIGEGVGGLKPTVDFNGQAIGCTFDNLRITDTTGPNPVSVSEFRECNILVVITHTVGGSNYHKCNFATGTANPPGGWINCYDDCVWLGNFDSDTGAILVYGDFFIIGSINIAHTGALSVSGNCHVGGNIVVFGTGHVLIRGDVYIGGDLYVDGGGDIIIRGSVVVSSTLNNNGIGVIQINGDCLVCADFYQADGGGQVRISGELRTVGSLSNAGVLYCHAIVPQVGAGLDLLLSATSDTQKIVMRGSLTVSQMKAGAKTTINIYGGVLTIGNSCTGGTITLFGDCKATDLSGGAVTVVDGRIPGHS